MNAIELSAVVGVPLGAGVAASWAAPHGLLVSAFAGGLGAVVGFVALPIACIAVLGVLSIPGIVFGRLFPQADERLFPRAGKPGTHKPDDDPWAEAFDA